MAKKAAKKKTTSKSTAAVATAKKRRLSGIVPDINLNKYTENLKNFRDCTQIRPDAAPTPVEESMIPAYLVSKLETKKKQHAKFNLFVGSCTTNVSEETGTAPYMDVFFQCDEVLMACSYPTVVPTELQLCKPS